MKAFYPYERLDLFLMRYADNYLLHFILPILSQTYKIKKTGSDKNKILLSHSETNDPITISIISYDKLILLNKFGSLTITQNTKIISIIEFISKLTIK